MASADGPARPAAVETLRPVPPIPPDGNGADVTSVAPIAPTGVQLRAGIQAARIATSTASAEAASSSAIQNGKGATARRNGSEIVCSSILLVPVQDASPGLRFILPSEIRPMREFDGERDAAKR